MKQEYLSSLLPGERARLKTIDGSEELCKRLRDLGWIPGTSITCVSIAPSGTPRAFWVRGSVIAIRLDACNSIGIVRYRE